MCPRRRHQPAEAVGVGLRPLGPVGRFDHVDVVVDRAGMLRIGRQHPFQCRDDVRGAALRRAAGVRPVIPGRQIHHRLGRQDSDLRILGKPPCDLGHRVGVGRVERLAVGGRTLRVAVGEGVDQSTLPVRGVGGVGLRLPQGLQGRRVGIRLHRPVDVGAEHQRLAPETHGAGGIETLRLAEGASRLPMVEGVGQAEPLVEKGLGLRAGGGDGP